MCAIAGIARASYYKWLNREIPEAELLNEAIAEAVMSIHKEYPDKGHRRIRDDLLRDCGFDVSDRRVLRICRIPGIKSTIKYERNSCTVNAKDPQHISIKVSETIPVPDTTSYQFFIISIVHLTGCS